jgi:hypothetical protein
MPLRWAVWARGMPAEDGLLPTVDGDLQASDARFATLVSEFGRDLLSPTRQAISR